MSANTEELKLLNRLWRLAWGAAVFCILTAVILYVRNTDDPGTLAYLLTLVALVSSNIALFVLQPKIDRLKK